MVFFCIEELRAGLSEGVHCTVAVINTRQELKEFSSFGYSHHIYDSLYVQIERLKFFCVPL